MCDVIVFTIRLFPIAQLNLFSVTVVVKGILYDGRPKYVMHFSCLSVQNVEILEFDNV